MPLTVTVNNTEVKGTLRLIVPPPPSDRIWMSFREMPEIKLAVHPSVGELRLKRYPMASYLVEQLKVGEREGKKRSGGRWGGKGGRETERLGGRCSKGEHLMALSYCTIIVSLSCLSPTWCC